MIIFKKILLPAVLLCFCHIDAFCQETGDFIRYEVREGYLLITELKNPSESEMTFIIDTAKVKVNSKDSTKCNYKCIKAVSVENSPYYKYVILNAKEKLREGTKVITTDTNDQSRNARITTAEKTDMGQTFVDNSEQSKVDSVELVKAFLDYIEKDIYYSADSFEKLKSDVNTHIDNIGFMDNENKKRYIIEKKLDEQYNYEIAVLNRHKNELNDFIMNFLDNKYRGQEIQNRQACLDKMKKIMDDKHGEREKTLDSLKVAINGNPSMARQRDSILSGNSLLVNVGIATVLMILFVSLIVVPKRKKAQKKPMATPQSTQSNAHADIVIRRKTTSILKTQSLEDVNDNPSYFQIDCSNFCDDSAVRKIYVKNACIKDIYNMYAEDLRNPDNPNEDGCMVLGRWVYDADTDEYYVSLEEAVTPGDDAIFMEYELNFGGKIKLKVSERLRRLRRDTNLQYDMTCWVHSHPGLGVFFSNADNNVQMQLKHPTHPKFLIAMVVDILTPEQELGIFTFKHDMTINSKSDLKKMYSLEELYKWAVSSDRNSFKPEDYFNLMDRAQNKLDSCYGIYLSNGAIIDMCQIENEQEAGAIQWVHGYKCEKNLKSEYVVRTVSKEKSVPDNEVIGCFLKGPHRSIPTIRKELANVKNIVFVLFLSTNDGLLSAIPIVDGQLSIEEANYGDEKIEELKIWTRRKR